MSEIRSFRSHWLAASIALAGAANLIRWWLLARPLWVDEEMIALNARWRSFADLAGPLWLDQTAPLGWLALERLALVTFGVDERAARALPTAFGIATLAVAVWIGRRWMSPVGAAILVAPRIGAQTRPPFRVDETTIAQIHAALKGGRTASAGRATD